MKFGRVGRSRWHLTECSNDVAEEKLRYSGLDPHKSREVVRLNSLGEVSELRHSPTDVSQDMSSRIVCDIVDSNYGDPIVPACNRR